jgi:hypothetical protein
MEHRTMTDVWTYRNPGWLDADLTGYEIEAADGDIGKVDECNREVGANYLVVDTGPWIFGKKVMLPAGVVKDIDHDSEKIFVDRTKDEIKNAPEFDEARYREPLYRDELGAYYGPRAADRRF